MTPTSGAANLADHDVPMTSNRYALRGEPCIDARRVIWHAPEPLFAHWLCTSAPRDRYGHRIRGQQTVCRGDVSQEADRWVVFMRREDLSPRQDGAAAVEMALLLPLLLAIVFGIIEFGFLFNAQISLTQAVREGVRVGAIVPEDASVTMDSRLQESYLAVRGGTPVPEVEDACAEGETTGQATLEARIDYEPIIGWFGDGIPIRATAVMRCGG